MLHRAVGRRVEVVVHGRGQAQRDEDTVAVGPRPVGMAEQIGHRVRKALGLPDLAVLHRAAGAHDGVAGAGQHGRVRIHRAGPVLQLAHKAVVQALEALLPGLAQVQLGEQPPHADGQARQQRAADLAEPAHRMGHRQARNPVGQQEVQIFLLQQAVTPGTQHFHGDVNSSGYRYAFGSSLPGRCDK
jgi:hypothetical protein